MNEPELVLVHRGEHLSWDVWTDEEGNETGVRGYMHNAPHITLFIFLYLPLFTESTLDSAATDIIGRLKGVFIPDDQDARDRYMQPAFDDAEEYLTTWCREFAPLIITSTLGDKS